MRNRDVIVLSTFLVSATTFFSGCGPATNSPGLQVEPIRPTAPVTNQQGGTDSGGGNFVASSPEQIKIIFNGAKGFDLKETVKATFENVSSQVLNKGLSPKLESIFSRMLGPKFAGDPFAINEDIDATPYILKEDGECIATVKDAIKEAATKIDEKKSPICFSLMSLVKFPIDAVPFQLVALAVHEHAHHYGFNEADAVLVQEQVLTMMRRGILNQLYFESLERAANIRDLSKRLIEKLDASTAEPYPDQLICKHLSTIRNSAERLDQLSFSVRQNFEHRMMTAAIGYEFGLSKNSFNGVEVLSKLSDGLLGFCGVDSVDGESASQAIPVANREKLRAVLDQLMQQGQASVTAMSRAKDEK